MKVELSDLLKGIWIVLIVIGDGFVIVEFIFDLSPISSRPVIQK